MKKTALIIGITLFIVNLLPAQNADGDLILRVHEQEQSVHIYHMMTPPLGHGTHFYRSIDGGEFERITVDPVMPLQRADLLEARLGSELFELLLEETQRETATSAFFALRNLRDVNSPLTILHPEFADILGRRFVDSDAPFGSEVTYRAVIVNDLGRPVDMEAEGSLRAEPHRLQQPDITGAESVQGWIELEWNYPATPGDANDGATFFRISLDENGAERERMFLRNAAQSSFTTRISAPEPGTEVVISVTPLDFIRQPGPSSDPVTILIVDDVPPPRVRGLAVRPDGDDRVNLSWHISPDPGATGYFVYRSQQSNEGYERIHEQPVPVSEPFYTDRVPSLRQQYFYRITAVDAAGNESVPSDLEWVFVEDHVPPVAPVNLQAVFNEVTGSVDLSWEDPQPDPNLMTYLLIRRSTLPGASTAMAQVNMDDITETTYSDRGFANDGFLEGAFYEYGIAAADSAYNLSDTLFVQLQIPGLTPPEPPSDLTARSDGNRINLQWSQTSSRSATHYHIYRYNDLQSDTLLAEVPVRRTTFRDHRVVRGMEYSYAIAAIDSFGTEGDRSDAVVEMMHYLNPPPRVRNVRVSRNGQPGALIRWEALPQGRITGYLVYRSDMATAGFQPISEEPVREPQFTDAGGEPGYWYRVVAVDLSENRSLPSEAVLLREIE